MSLIERNIVANFAGSIWQALMSLIFIPLYIKFMGIESWGLIGIFATLQAMFSLLDMGLSSTLNREMARLSVLPSKKQEMRNLVRTLEMFYWSVAVFAGITVVLLSPIIAHHWIKAGQLPPKTVEQAVLIMGFVMALQMPIGFYSGGLMGLQRQVLLNAVNIGTSTLSGVGAVVILWLVSPTVQAFFLWQVIISAIRIFLLVLFLWRRLPRTDNKAVFQKQLLKGIWKFAAGMGGTSILAVILTQLDKIILSKMLTLEMFGYYTVAGVVAVSLYRIISPVFTAVYPSFTQLVSLSDYDGVKRFYHKSCQVMSVLVLPVAIVIVLFSYEIILLWTQNPVAAEKCYLLASILVCGTAIHGLMHLPYALQLAFGWTRLSFFKTLIAVIILVPLIIYMAMRYGAIGAASVWLVLNMGLLVFEIPIMHHRLLRTEKWRWYLYDVGFPLITCIFVAGFGRIFIREPMPQYMMLLYLIIVLVLTLGIAILITPVTRTWLFKQLLRIKISTRSRIKTGV